MTNYDLTLGINDTHATITWNIVDEDGSAVNLTAATTVDFVVIQDPSWKQEKVMTISDAANGEVTVQLDAGMLREGRNDAHAEINWSSGKKSYSITDYKIRGLRI